MICSLGVQCKRVSLCIWACSRATSNFWIVNLIGSSHIFILNCITPSINQGWATAVLQYYRTTVPLYFFIQVTYRSTATFKKWLTVTVLFTLKARHLVISCNTFSWYTWRQSYKSRFYTREPMWEWICERLINDFIINSNEAAIPNIPTVNEFQLYLTEENENFKSLNKYSAVNKLTWSSTRLFHRLP